MAPVRDWQASVLLKEIDDFEQDFRLRFLSESECETVRLLVGKARLEISDGSSGVAEVRASLNSARRVVSENYNRWLSSYEDALVALALEKHQ